MLKTEYSNIISNNYNEMFNENVLKYINFKYNTSYSEINNNVIEKFIKDDFAKDCFINIRFKQVSSKRKPYCYIPFILSKEIYLYLSKDNSLNYEILNKWFNKKIPLFWNNSDCIRINRINESIETTIITNIITEWSENKSSNINDLTNMFINDEELQILLIKLLVYNTDLLTFSLSYETGFYIYYISYIIAKELKLNNIVEYVNKFMESNNFINKKLLEIDVHYIKLLCEKINDNTLYNIYMKKLNNKPVDRLSEIINILDNDNSFKEHQLISVMHIINMLNYYVLEGNTEQINKFLLSNDLLSMFDKEKCIDNIPCYKFNISTYLYKRLTQMYSSEDDYDKLFYYIIGNRYVNTNFEIYYHFVMYEWPNMLNYLTTNNYKHITVKSETDYFGLKLDLSCLENIKDHSDIYLLRYFDYDVTDFINKNSHH